MNTLPYLTGDLPGSGGRVRAAPEDFRVDEVPAYLPQGSGTHLWLRIEKRDRTTRDVVRALSRELGVAERDAGFAGMKDRAAVTTQWLSFPVARDPKASALAGDGYRILEVSRHANKLRTGHLRANRFAIAVRGGDIDCARTCAEALRLRGLPNFFGPQRFGAQGKNAELGRLLLLGQTDHPEARRAMRDRFLRRLVLSAWQASLFNAWLSGRLAEGTFATARAGEVMKKLGSGGVFVCRDPAADTARIAAFEISPGGPMFGHKMVACEGEALAREENLLRADGLSMADLARGGGETEGTRRAGRIPVAVELAPIDGGYEAAFELPRGSYATVVMGELTKAEVAELPHAE